MYLNNACAFTGHRPERLPWGYDEEDYRCIQFKVDLETQIRTLYAQGITHYISGMALGTDQYFAETVLALQDQGVDIILECAIPCETQSKSWTLLQKERYRRIIDHAQLETVVQNHYTRDCMMRRNRYMVNSANTLLAAYDGNSKGGTARTIAYAMKKNVNLLILTLYGEEYK